MLVTMTSTDIVRKAKALVDRNAEVCLVGLYFTYFSTLLIQKTAVLVTTKAADIVRKAKLLACTYADWCLISWYFNYFSTCNYSRWCAFNDEVSCH